MQIVNVKSESTALGGAGNVIHNLKALGARADIISVIGCCEASSEMKALLEKMQVSNKYLVTQEDRLTGTKSRIIASQKQVLRYDRETSAEISI